jgi:NADP-dependent 3-hydroxy acid dehydrogenase YdfG
MSASAEPPDAERGLAWITGASTGIGRAVALEFARRGWHVAASARDAAALDVLATENGRIHPRPVDVTDAQAMLEAVGAIEAAHGPIRRVLLNAGTYVPVDARQFKVDAFRRLIDVNVMGVVHGLAAVLPRMIQRRAGEIAIVASVAGYRGLPSAAAYGATKAALINLAESLKFDLDHLGIRTQLVNPGFVETPLTARNSFPMPFLIPVEDAARRIADGMESDRFEIAFPRRFALLLKLVGLLPDRLYFRLVHRATGQ